MKWVRRILLLVCGVFVVFAGAAACQGETEAAVGGLLLALVALGGERVLHVAERKVASLRKGPQCIAPELLADVSAEEQARLGELYEKAQADFLALEKERRLVGDAALSRQLGRLAEIAGRMLAYMGEHPRKIPLARKFIDYYQDRALKLVREYNELSRMGLHTEEVAATQRKICTTLDSFDEAYTAEFEKMLAERLMDVDAELSVMQQTLAADGIENETPADEAEATSPGEVAADADAVHAAGADGDATAGGRVAGAPTGQRTWAERLAERARAKQGPLAQPQIGRRNLTERLKGAVRGQGETLPAAIPPPLYPDVRRQRIVMTVLAVLLGTFGAHRFYQGRIGLGLVYVLFCGTGLSTLVSLCEGIRYATMPLERFYEKVYRP